MLFVIIANEISNVTFSVILACPESFFKRDSRQAGMTTLKSYVNLLNAFVLVTPLITQRIKRIIWQ